ncbi:MAG: hypothetical protein L0L02_06935 [Corynebacterium variabile]|nr:hypothetical protein [Corynebacterium variabile]
MTTPSTEPQTTESPADSATPWGKLIGIVLALSAVICLMLLAFLTPSYNSGAKDLPILSPARRRPSARSPPPSTRNSPAPSTPPPTLPRRTPVTPSSTGTRSAASPSTPTV